MCLGLAVYKWHIVLRSSVRHCLYWLMRWSIVLCIISYLNVDASSFGYQGIHWREPWKSPFRCCRSVLGIIFSKRLISGKFQCRIIRLHSQVNVHLLNYLEFMPWPISWCLNLEVIICNEVCWRSIPVACFLPITSLWSTKASSVTIGFLTWMNLKYNHPWQIFKNLKIQLDLVYHQVNLKTWPSLHRVVIV